MIEPNIVDNDLDLLRRDRDSWKRLAELANHKVDLLRAALQDIDTIAVRKKAGAAGQMQEKARKALSE